MLRLIVGIPRTAVCVDRASARRSTSVRAAAKPPVAPDADRHFSRDVGRTAAADAVGRCHCHSRRLVPRVLRTHAAQLLQLLGIVCDITDSTGAEWCAGRRVCPTRPSAHLVRKLWATTSAESILLEILTYHSISSICRCLFRNSHWARYTVQSKAELKWQCHSRKVLRQCTDRYLQCKLLSITGWYIRGGSRGVSRHPPFCLGALFWKEHFWKHVVTVFSWTGCFVNMKQEL